jgi:hypothetical protein
MHKLITRRKVAAAVTLVALSAAGMVFAAWLTSGSGSGYAKAGTAQDLTTVGASASTSATLYPGATGDAVVRISNPNPFPVRVTSVSLNGTAADIAPDTGHPSCSPTGVSFTDQTGLSIDVPAESAATATLTGSVSMSNASANGCQGATFEIPVDLVGSSAAS